MRLRLPVATIVCLLLVSACATPQIPLQRAQGDSLRSGDSAAEATAKIGQATATLDHRFEWNGKQMQARHYNLQVGTRQEMTMVCTPACIPIFYNVAVTAPYVVVLQGDPPAVVASGLVEELSRSPNEAISGFMPSLKDSAEKARAAAKK